MFCLQKSSSFACSLSCEVKNSANGTVSQDEDVNQRGLLGNASPAENVAHKYNTPLTMLGDSRKLLIDCWFKKYIYLSLCLSEAFFPIVF